MDRPPLRVRVPATSANLGPGYDAFGVALTRHLVAEVTARADARVETVGEGAGEVATGDDNLVWASLAAFCDAYGVAPPDVSLRVDNRVPLERGLGSSSAAIVAGLVLARAVSGVTVGDRDLVALATRIEGHPDNVVPALLGGVTVTASTGDGTLVVRRVQPHARLRPVLFVPAQRQNTAAARSVLPTEVALATAADQAARAGHVLGAFIGAWPVDARLAGDHLHEPRRLEVMAASGVLVSELRAEGHHSWLSGAGPAVGAAVTRPTPTEPIATLARRHGFELVMLDWDLSGATTA
ncbi:MAG: homoserine kinase [Actinobacteria bacterium]|nr:homoserine kinase [Actinomycetota bacterium]